MAKRHPPPPFSLPWPIISIVTLSCRHAGTLEWVPTVLYALRRPHGHHVHICRPSAQDVLVYASYGLNDVAGVGTDTV